MMREVLSPWKLVVYGGAPLKIVAAMPAYQWIYGLVCYRASPCQPERATRCASAPSAGPLWLRCTVGPQVLRSESFHGGLNARRVSEALRVGFLCFRRAGRGTGITRLCPPGRPPLPRGAAGRQVLDGGPFLHGSGARWHQKSSDARQSVCFGGH
ncbi:hypothetical protein NDU88_007435 [Pleurodeles waltl]|uniref:Uncharacterized protein n=1 Tax=Pleurodeles waltl TaxID=8319 RepID=A0AAV7VTN5_PLEWA|nr:hypothetical protein NDU88_007435 [Pleurodeles waltl]